MLILAERSDACWLVGEDLLASTGARRRTSLLGVQLRHEPTNYPYLCNAYRFYIN